MSDERAPFARSAPRPRVKAPTPPPILPGGIGATHLRVYDSVGPDGLAGGTPHLHTACTEAYLVMAGEGTVQTVSGEGYRDVSLAPGALVWFTPGTIHRLVNRSGDLEIVVLMQNAGLPERGDLVITFADDVLADPDRYRAAAELPEGCATTGGPDGGAAARARRDGGVAGFVELVAALDDGHTDALVRLYRRAASLVAPHLDSWGPVIDAGPATALATTARHLTALAEIDAHHLMDSVVHERTLGDERRYGCCGTLGIPVMP